MIKTAEQSLAFLIWEAFRLSANAFIQRHWPRPLMNFFGSIRIFAKDQFLVCQAFLRQTKVEKIEMNRRLDGRAVQKVRVN